MGVYLQLKRPTLHDAQVCDREPRSARLSQGKKREYPTSEPRLIPQMWVD